MTLQQFFQNKRICPPAFDKFKRENQFQFNLLEQQYKNSKYYNNNTLYQYIIRKLNGFKKCLCCDKELNINQIRLHKKYCSVSCAQKNRDKKQWAKKFIATMNERYGGVNNVINSKQSRQKAKQTNLEKYGHECCFSNKAVREKMAKTNLEKYGVENPFANQQIKEKIKQTNLEKYGVERNFYLQSFRQQSKKTCLQKYGVQHPMKNNKIKNNVVQKRKKERFQKIVQRIKDYVIPMFNVEQYKGVRNFSHRWKCVKCGNEWEQFLHSSVVDGTQKCIPRCLVCYPYVDGIHESYTQKQVIAFVKTIENNLEEHVKDIIKPYELDIYIPQKNIAIQFDGIFWHSDQKKPNDYHLMKTQMCKEKGIQLIHIFQDQWLYKQQIVKDRIKNVLGVYDNRIFARKCQVKEIKSSVCNQFLDTNHIQGRDNSKIRLGLFYNDQLVSIMTFGKPRFNKNYEYQLVRFASKLGNQVVGGASKLLKCFQRKYQPKSLISYADCRYSNGKLYYALGFEFLNNSESNYCWIKSRRRYSRYQCQKHKLKQLLGQDKFNPQLSESQNMYLNGFNKIYDCGNMVFIKNY